MARVIPPNSRRRRPMPGRSTLAPTVALALGILATWRVAHLVAREDGPFDLVLRARTRAGDSVVGRLMDCPYCVSVWAALPIAGWLVRRLRWPTPDAVPVWLALSAGASLLERAVVARAPATADAGFELLPDADAAVPTAPHPDRGGPHAVLR